ncbi:MAG: polysaccharide biosynthesis tyrosine autokinase [Micrococcus sp.]|nr:polysaccharide biosynthesis tyrosine autokinase [Micrococcus sp.]
MNLVDLLRVLRANRWVLVLSTALGLAVGLIFSWVQPTVYTAVSTGLVVVEGEATLSGTETAQGRARSYVPLINSRPVRERVMEATGLESGGISLQGAVVPDTNLIQVSANATSAQGAADLANEALVATAHVANDLDPTSNVRVTAMEDALPPAGPSSPHVLRNAAIGMALGLVAGIVVSLLRRVVDLRIRTTTDAQNATGAGLLGVIPKDETLVTEADARLGTPAPRAAEAIRQLRTNLRFVGVDHQPRSIAVTSSNPGEGKSTVISHLALTVAAAGERVILIDADLRRPRQAGLFGLKGRVGLSEVLMGAAQLDDALAEVGAHGLMVLPSGRRPPNPSELLGSQRMRELVAELAETHLVFIDAPPVLPVTDSTLLARSVDGTVLVTRHGKTPKEHLQVAAEMLANVDAVVLGVVVNGVPAAGIGADYYGGGYGAAGSDYSAYYGDDAAMTDDATHGTAADVSTNEERPPQM